MLFTTSNDNEVISKMLWKKKKFNFYDNRVSAWNATTFSRKKRIVNYITHIFVKISKSFRTTCVYYFCHAKIHDMIILLTIRRVFSIDEKNYCSSIRSNINFC